MPKRSFAVKCEIRRKYGDHEILFGLAEQVECETVGEVKEAFISLQSLLENQITVYEAVSLPYIKLPQSQNADNGGNHSADSFTLETILVENVGGVKRLKAVGGKWKKYGVPIYPECATDLPLKTLDYGSHDFRHLKLTVKAEMEGDNPKRVVSIR